MEEKVLEGTDPLLTGSLPCGTHPGSKSDTGEQDSQQPSVPLPSSLTQCHFLTEVFGLSKYACKFLLMSSRVERGSRELCKPRAHE